MKTIERNGHEISFDEDLAIRWIEALESGGYEQTIGELRNQDRFCCLGVACDVANPNGWEKDVDGFVFDGEHNILPMSIAESLGVAIAGGRLDEEVWSVQPDIDDESSLASANDCGEVTFLDIAAALRDYYEFPARETAATS